MLELEPENGEAYHFLGLISYDLNQTEKALQYYQKAEELGFGG
jgi:tetratricopeptide (TPR) repeat protein